MAYLNVIIETSKATLYKIPPTERYFITSIFQTYSLNLESWIYQIKYEE